MPDRDCELAAPAVDGEGGVAVTTTRYEAVDAGAGNWAVHRVLEAEGRQPRRLQAAGPPSYRLDRVAAVRLARKLELMARRDGR